MQTCARLSNENHASAHSVCIPDLIVDTWALASKIREQELRCSDFIKDPLSDQVLVFDIVCPDCTDIELCEHLLDSVAYILEFGSRWGPSTS